MSSPFEHMTDEQIKARANELAQELGYLDGDLHYAHPEIEPTDPDEIRVRVLVKQYSIDHGGGEKSDP